MLSSTAWTTLKVCFCKWCEETHSCFYPGMLCHQTQKSSDLSTVAGGVLLGSAASNGFWLGLGPWVRRKFWRCFYFAFLGPEGENNIHRIHVVYDILYTVFIHHKRKFYKSVWELYLCVYIYMYLHIHTFLTYIRCSTGRSGSWGEWLSWTGHHSLVAQRGGCWSLPGSGYISHQTGRLENHRPKLVPAGRGYVS